MAVQHLAADFRKMKGRYESRAVGRYEDRGAEADDDGVAVKCDRVVEVSSHHVIECVVNLHQGDKRCRIVDMANDLQQ